MEIIQEKIKPLDRIADIRDNESTQLSELLLAAIADAESGNNTKCADMEDLFAQLDI